MNNVIMPTETQRIFTRLSNEIGEPFKIMKLDAVDFIGINLRFVFPDGQNIEFHMTELEGLSKYDEAYIISNIRKIRQKVSVSE